VPLVMMDDTSHICPFVHLDRKPSSSRSRGSVCMCFFSSTLVFQVISEVCVAVNFVIGVAEHKRLMAGFAK
jgi:hypothetical protein